MRLVRPYAFLLVTALFVAGPPLRARGENPEPAPTELRSETQDGNRRVGLARVGAPPSEAPLIGYIDSPTVSCYQPDPAEDVCYINWLHMYVDAAPDYIIWMEVTINAFGKVARYHGFFQTDMYAPFGMRDRGFKVACGPLGAGGNPDWGNAYSWTISARDSAGMNANNYGTTYCPGFTP